MAVRPEGRRVSLRATGAAAARPAARGRLGLRQSPFALSHDWESTRDPAAYLAVPAAIEFVRAHGRGEECRELLHRGSALLADAGFEPLAPEQPLQMAAFRLPPCDPEAVQRRLFEEFRIEVPVRAWNGRHLVRVSVAPYNEPSDLERLADALAQVLPA